MSTEENLTERPVPKIKEISMMKAWKDSKVILRLDCQGMCSMSFSQAYREYTLFIQSLNRAVHGLKNSDSVPISPVGIWREE